MKELVETRVRSFNREHSRRSVRYRILSVLAYEVDQIRTVLPDEVKELQIVPGADYCTLVTCTPYGINSHRLLVRGHRVEAEQTGAAVISEAVLIEPLVVAPVLAMPLLMILVLMVLFQKPKQENDSMHFSASDAENGDSEKEKEE